MTEYEQIRLMHHQEYLLKEKKVNYFAPWKKWLGAKKVIKAALEQLGENEKQLRLALKFSVEVCLSIRNCIKRAPKSTVPGQHRFGFEKPCFCSL